MCSSGSSAAGENKQAAGEHAWVESVDTADGSNSTQREFRVVVNVPFPLASMAEASLDISPEFLRLQGPRGAAEEVCVPMPVRFRLDSENAVARYSKKKNQLTVTSPNLAKQVTDEAQPQTTPVLAAPAEATAETVAETPVGMGDEDDDDDLPPPLDGAHSVQPSSSTPPASTTASSWTTSDDVEGNEVAEAMMQKALAAREQKRIEAEESRRKADLAGSGGLKKGFFAAKPSKKNGAGAPKSTSQNAEPITYIGAPADPEAARKQSLQLPEVQQALRNSTNKLKEDNSWVTPQLLQALQSRPDLTKGLSNPKVQEAMALMQKDPTAAQKKYSSDPEVTKFLQEFSGLMATHFDVLSKEQDGNTTSASSTAVSQQSSSAPALVGGYSGGAAHAAPATSPEMVVMENPEVQAAFKDPEVQQLLAELRAGRHLEIHELARTNPRLVHHIRILLNNGLLSMQH